MITVATPADAAARRHRRPAGRRRAGTHPRRVRPPPAPGEVGLVYDAPARLPRLHLPPQRGRAAGHRPRRHGQPGRHGLPRRRRLPVHLRPRLGHGDLGRGQHLPAEIEHELVRYPGVADCVVFGVPDDEYGERLLAMVQPVPGAQLEEGAMVEWLRGRLSGFKVPRTIVIEPQLPRDETGSWPSAACATSTGPGARAGSDAAGTGPPASAMRGADAGRRAKRQAGRQAKDEQKTSKRRAKDEQKTSKRRATGDTMLHRIPAGWRAGLAAALCAAPFCIPAGIPAARRRLSRAARQAGGALRPGGSADQLAARWPTAWAATSSSRWWWRTGPAPTP